jgi:hypothetical protein
MKNYFIFYPAVFFFRLCPGNKGAEKQAEWMALK